MQSFYLSARAMLSQTSCSRLTIQFMLGGFGGVFIPLSFIVLSFSRFLSLLYWYGVKRFSGQGIVPSQGHPVAVGGAVAPP